MRHADQLEPRRLLASFTASTVAELIGDISAANAAGGSNTITLAPGAVFKLNVVDNSSGVVGANGLPVVAAGDDLTILGNGDAIQRSTAKSTPAFRLFAVDTGASLTLVNLTLANGAAVSSAAPDSAQGGAVRSQGTLTLDGVTVQNSTARAQGWDWAYGGGVFSNGVLAIANSTIQNNQALGGTGTDLSGTAAGVGRPALGGGLYVGGSATLTNTTLSSNLARGGDGGKGFTFRGKGSFPGIVRGGSGGTGWGGGIFVGAATLQLRGTTINQNAATGGTGGTSPKGLPDGANGTGQGGGVYIYPGSSITLDSFTAANTTGNSASTSDNDIFGSFSILA